jgi:hypothetical protein
MKKEVGIRERDIRAKFGINDTESIDEIGNVCWTIGAVSVRHGKVSDGAGMNHDLSIARPKLDVTGSVPVARAKNFQPVQPVAYFAAFGFFRASTTRS